MILYAEIQLELLFTIASLYINALNDIVGDKEGAESPLLLSLPLNNLFQVFGIRLFKLLSKIILHNSYILFHKIRSRILLTNTCNVLHFKIIKRSLHAWYLFIFYSCISAIVGLHKCTDFLI